MRCSGALWGCSGAQLLHKVCFSARDHERKQNDRTDPGADLCAHAPDLGSGLLRSSPVVSKTSLVKPLDLFDPEHP